MTITQIIRWNWHKLAWDIKNCELKVVLWLAEFINNHFGKTKIGGSICDVFLNRSVEILKWKDLELAWEDDFMIELGAVRRK